MVLNAKGNDFIFRFPNNFFPTHIVDRYTKLLKQLPTSYKDIGEYINSTIQSISFPDLNANLVTQKGQYKTPRIYRSGYDVAKLLDKTITVEFKLTEHFINFFFLQECFIDFFSYDRDDNRTTDTYPEFLPDVIFNITSLDGFVTIKLIYQDLLYNKLTNPMKFNYSDVKNTYKTFSLEFKYNDIDFDYSFEEGDSNDILTSSF